MRRATGSLRFLATLGAGALALGAGLGCSSDDPSEGSGGGGGAAPEATALVERGAAGVTIREVAIYQGVRRSLVDGGVLSPSDVPIVAGRDAVVRVFYNVTRDVYDGSEVTARFTWDDGETVEVTKRLGLSSQEDNLVSTFHIEIPAARVTAGPLDLKVELVQQREVPAEEAEAPDPAPVVWSSGGAIEVEGDAKPFRVVLVPVQYQADGSGRLPDTSPGAVEAYRSRIKTLYPVSDVEVTVRSPMTWGGQIDASGDGWGALLDSIMDLRGRDAPADDVYYYGVFLPEEDFGGYCRAGCVLGLTYLNDQPTQTGSIDLRMAIGVGYLDYAPDTAAHELGHAHGRGHAPCGGPQGVDRNYPYEYGTIGVWGLEPGSLLQHSPSETDFMGYCHNTFTSDYTYSAIFDRMQSTKSALRAGKLEPVSALRVGIDQDGNVTSHGMTQVDMRTGGAAVPATITGASGLRAPSEARVLRYDHLPGATILLPGVDESARRVELVVDGRPLVLSL
jgi:hypothetical protein